MFFAVARHGLDRFPASLPEASGLVKLTKPGPISPTMVALTGYNRVAQSGGNMAQNGSTMSK